MNGVSEDVFADEWPFPLNQIHRLESSSLSVYIL